MSFLVILIGYIKPFSDIFGYIKTHGFTSYVYRLSANVSKLTQVN